MIDPKVEAIISVAGESAKIVSFYTFVNSDRRTYEVYKNDNVTGSYTDIESANKQFIAFTVQILARFSV